MTYGYAERWWTGSTDGTTPLEQLIAKAGFRSLYAVEAEGGPCVKTLNRILDGGFPRRDTLKRLAKVCHVSTGSVAKAALATAQAARR
jgi:hypothetical protein